MRRLQSFGQNVLGLWLQSDFVVSWLGQIHRIVLGRRSAAGLQQIQALLATMQVGERKPRSRDNPESGPEQKVAG